MKKNREIEPFGNTHFELHITQKPGFVEESVARLIKTYGEWPRVILREWDGSELWDSGILDGSLNQNTWHFNAYMQYHFENCCAGKHSYCGPKFNIEFKKPILN